MRILVAPDKFKGSLDARAVGENIAAGLRSALPGAEIILCPIADGGEGTAEILCAALAGEWIMTPAHDALGRPVEARFAWMAERRLAVVDLAEVAGLSRLVTDERDPLRASSFGLGEVLLAIEKRGAKEIMVGLGGSATNDGGLGLARALGFEFKDERGEPLFHAADITRLRGIAAPGSPLLAKVLAAVDVQNPLLGMAGATRVFGPQKGATPAEIEILEAGLARLAEVVTRDLGADHRNVAGAGAAGGLGFGLLSFCSATIRAGFDVVAEALHLDATVRAADVVITGEGRLDAQTLQGKAPAGLAVLARRFGKPVYMIAGQVSDDADAPSLFRATRALMRPSMGEQECIARTPELLRARARELGGHLLHVK